MPATIRPATPDDAEALAGLHLRVWRAAYADLAPPAAFAALDLDRRLGQWRAALARPLPHRTWLAEAPANAPGGPLGLVSAGPPSDPAFGGRGEIRHLYVEPQAQGQGLGRALLRAAAAHLLAEGFPGVALAVVAANQPARAFYARLGGVEGIRYRDAGPLWRSENLVVSWDGMP